MVFVADREFTYADLRELRERLGLSQEEMAERHFGVKRSTYANWELPDRGIPANVLFKAKQIATQVEIGDFKVPAPNIMIPLPFIGGIAASSKVNWTDPFAAESLEYVPTEMGIGRGRFACRILGDSMYDLLWPNDLCVFQALEVPKLRAVVLYRTAEHQATIKQLLHDGKAYILHPLNPTYEDVTVDGGRVVGELIGIVRENGSRKITIYDSSGIRP